jgi:hypothetical protein
VAVLGGGTRLTRWQRLVLEHLVAEGVRVCGRVEDARSRARRSPAARLADALRRPEGAWELYADAWVGRRSRAAAPVDAADLWAGVPVLEAVPRRQGRWSEHFDEAVLDQIRAWEPDLLLRFGFGIIRGEILEAAPLGVWSFHHDDELVYRGGPPCFWEVARGDPLAAVTLQRLTDRLDGGIVLAKAWFATVGGSYVATRDRVYLGSVDLPALVVRALRAGARMPTEPSRTDAAVLRAPRPAALLRAGARALAARRWDRRSPEDRRVELRLRPSAPTTPPPRPSAPAARELENESPADSFSRSHAVDIGSGGRPGGGAGPA